MKINFPEGMKEIIEKKKDECRNARGDFLLKLNVEGFPFAKHLSYDRDEYKDVASQLTHFETIVVLGIGGSALGTRMLYEIFKKEAQKKLMVLDTTDPMIIDELLDEIVIEDTVFISISKSGSTMETASLTLFFINKLRNIFGQEWKNHMVFITDPNSGDLRKYVEEKRLHSLPIPSDLGGRYSVLSNVGLFPLYLAGINIDGVLKGASDYLISVKNDKEIEPFSLSSANYEAYLKGKNILALFPYAGKLKLWGEWFVQLWGESLGKIDNEGRNVGQTPLIAVGPTDQHSIIQLFTQGPRDKFILFFDIEKRGVDHSIDLELEYSSFHYLFKKGFKELIDAESAGTRENLESLGIPTSSVVLKDLSHKSVGELIMFSYVFTVFTSFLLGVDPFDQPGVEGGKKIMYRILGRD